MLVCFRLAGLGLFAILLAAQAPAARAQCPNPTAQQIFSAADTLAGDGFGHSICVRGDVAIVGAPWADGGGKAYVFRRASGGAWIEEATLLAPLPDNAFGFSVGIDGDRAIIGAPRPFEAGRGTAYIYELQATWTLVASFIGPSFGGGWDYGRAVDIDGDRALIGSPAELVGTSIFFAGKVRALERNAGTWLLVEELTHPLPTVARQFGAAVSLRDGVAVVGAPQDPNDPELPAGGQEVFLYKLDAGGWTYEQHFTGSNNSRFGSSVDTDGGRVAVGAPGVYTQDAVIVLHKGGAGTWEVQAQLGPPAGFDPFMRFGASVSIEHDALAVGGATESNGITAPSFVYTEVAPGAWELRSTFLSTNPNSADVFGADVELDGDRVLIGAPWRETDPQSGVGVVTASDQCTFWTACAGDGSGSPCPCSNPGASGRGCANGTFASGARLTASGWPGVVTDEVTLRVEGSVPAQPGLFFQGDALIGGGAGAPFGDGLRCVGVNVVRLQTVAADGAGAATSSLPLAATGGLTAGQSTHYQWWYRDPGGSPCGTGFNLSNALGVTWYL